MSALQSVPAPRPGLNRGGRPRNDNCPRQLARNTRWWITYTLTDLPMSAIAGAERVKVSKNTVSVGIAEARDRIAGCAMLRPLLLAVIGGMKVS